MNSFTVIAIGHLAKDPDVMSRNDLPYFRFCLVANDYGGKDPEGEARELVTSVWFVAFGDLGEAIARNARRGDQLIVTAQMRASNWVDRHGDRQYGYSYIAQGFRFGAPGKAKREGLVGQQAPGEQYSEPAPDESETETLNVVA